MQIKKRKTSTKKEIQPTYNQQINKRHDFGLALKEAPYEKVDFCKKQVITHA